MARWLARSLTASVDPIDAGITVDGRFRGRGLLQGRSRSPAACPCHVAVLLAVALSLNSVAMWQTSKVDMVEYMEEEEPEESFCTYEGYVKTERNWFGFLANLTVADTGRLMFEFRYPADNCCLNILFYTGDQLSGVSSRINCWQREELLHPEDDQILRLTPSFSWSGCRLTKSAGVPTYICKGGRTLTNDRTTADHPLTWYVAISNCAALYGIELTYRLELHGPVASCPANDGVVADTTWRNPWTFTTTTPSSAKAASLIPRQAEQTLLEEKDQTVCIVEGEVNTTIHDWAGFFRNLSLNDGGGFHYEFTYPFDMQIQNIILYDEDDIRRLSARQNCWEKERIIHPLHVPEKIIDLSYKSMWHGCISRNGQYSVNVTCSGVRRFDVAHKIFMAVSNCRSNRGLLLYYKLGVFGFNDAELCNSGRNQATFLHRQLLDCYIFIISIILLKLGC